MATSTIPSASFYLDEKWKLSKKESLSRSRSSSRSLVGLKNSSSKTSSSSSSETRLTVEFIESGDGFWDLLVCCALDYWGFGVSVKVERASQHSRVCKPSREEERKRETMNLAAKVEMRVRVMGCSVQHESPILMGL